MSDVLSQSEIDALFAAMASGGLNEEIIEKPINEESNTPSSLLEGQLKFSEKDLQLLEYIHKEYAEELSSNLIKNTEIKVSLESIQEISYEEFKHSIPCPAAMAIFKLKPFEGYLLFETSTDFISKIANLYSDKAENQRQEMDTFKQITGSFIKYLEKPWGNALAVTPLLEYIEENPANIKEFLPNESVALLSLSVTFNKGTDLFNICIPYSSVERHLGGLSIRNDFQQMGSSSSFENTLMNIKAVLADISIPLSELVELQKGVVLNTYKTYDSKVKILVEEKHCFDGEAGLFHGRKAVMIKNCLDKDV
jgi:flagellar motor switch protein FliM